MCSACGFRDGPKPLEIRTWICPESACRATHDRDFNAAKNVRYVGRRILAATEPLTEPPTPGPGARRR
ncbi:zinc ribbon domain-containing protein [Nocardiopsis mangrovi]|uniref:zinc ribbon domain-containing protein n=1 Tax=Nocardiopsis mangrovi TaxID=1179818 RepID=UPI003671EF69